MYFSALPLICVTPSSTKVNKTAQQSNKPKPRHSAIPHKTPAPSHTPTTSRFVNIQPNQTTNYHPPQTKQPGHAQPHETSTRSFKTKRRLMFLSRAAISRPLRTQSSQLPPIHFAPRKHPPKPTNPVIPSQTKPVPGLLKQRANHPLTTKHPRTAVREYVEFYNQERPHQGLDNELVIDNSEGFDSDAPVKVKERLGGLLNYYYR